MPIERSHGRPYPQAPRADELPATNAAETAANLAERRRRGRPFERGNQAAKGRRPALALLGIEVEAADPVYQRMLRHAHRYRRRRVSELHAVHGYVSAGAAGLLASAALALAGSRYAYALAAKGGKEAASWLKLGATLADSARNAELSAVEVAKRDAAGKPKPATAYPWLAPTRPVNAPAPESDAELDPNPEPLENGQPGGKAEGSEP